MNPGTQQNSWLTETFYDIPNLFRRFNADRNKGNYEIHCLEFSYNMISGNIKMANMRMIMKLIGITQMPNIMFLIQLDDYSETYRPNPDFSSYPCKVSIVQNLQTYLERKSIQGVVARFIGFDSIALYLYAEGKALSEAEARGRVGALAQDIVSHVGEQTGESISIGVSDFCHAPTQFPQAYMECRAAVLQGFYAGRRSVSFHDKNKVFSSIARIPIMRTAAVNILSAMDRYNNARCGEIVAEVCDRLKEMEIHPAAARLQMIALVGRVTDYYIEAGLDADEIEALAVNSMTNLLSCGFIGDAREIVEAFCDSIQKLNKSSHQSVDARFRQYVDDCIEKYSADCSFSLSFAAELSNYSPSYFSRLFARVYGMPFSRYLADYRVERAVRLLTQESLSLQDIALKTGFRSTSYFCSVFKGRMGISPRQYQNRRSRKIGEKPLKAGDAGGGAAYGAEDVEGMEGLAGMEGMEGMEGVADTEDASVAPGGAAESEAESEAEAPAGADGAGPIEGEPALLTK